MTGNREVDGGVVIVRLIFRSLIREPTKKKNDERWRRHCFVILWSIIQNDSSALLRLLLLLLAAKATEQAQ